MNHAPGNERIDEDPIRGDDRERAVMVLPREVDSIASARHWLTDFLQGAGARPEPIVDAVLVVSELVTNALRHGLGDVAVRASIEPPDVVHLAVTDSGDGNPAVQPVDANRVGGVGLRIVAEVASDWGVVQFPGGTTVWATLGRPGA